MAQKGHVEVPASPCHSLFSEALSFDNQEDGRTSQSVRHATLASSRKQRVSGKCGQAANISIMQPSTPKSLTKIASPISVNTRTPWLNFEVDFSKYNYLQCYYNPRDDIVPDIVIDTDLKLPPTKHTKPDPRYPVVMPFRPALRPMTLEAQVMETVPPPRFSSNRRAVIIGISYCWTKDHKDVPGYAFCAKRWFDICVRRLGFCTDEVWILCDMLLEAVGRARKSHPTSQNIRSALSWLVRGAREGDHLFLSYNGDTVCNRASENESSKITMDGILSSDSGDDIITCKELNSFFKAVPPRVNLTTFLDCRRSFELTKLPHVLFAQKNGKTRTTEIRKAPDPGSIYNEPILSAFENKLKGEAFGPMKAKISNRFDNCMETYENLKAQFKSTGNVICFTASPKRNERIKHPKFISRRSLTKTELTDIIHTAIDETFRDGMAFTYGELLKRAADLIVQKGNTLQLPQIVSSHSCNGDEVFAI